MDILVTTPKSAHETAKQEAELVANDPEAYWFRTFARKPNVSVGDKVYYVDNGCITGYGIIFEISQESIDCDVTGKNYSGYQLKQRKWVALKTPIPFKGFQGYRYVERIPELCSSLSEKTSENP
jgi:hypothetical protein